MRVQLTGLYALERLAKTYPGHRQVIVNALCAYLQVPPASIWAEPACTRGEFMLADSPELGERCFPSAAPTTLHAATTGRVILGAVPAPLRRYAPIG